MKLKSLLVVTLVAVVSSSTTFALGKMFGDVSLQSWYGPSVEKLAGIGIIKGYADGSFKPNNNVTRAEVAVMLDRTIQYMETGKVESLEVYYNTKFNYQLSVPAGATLNTDLIMGTVAREEAAYIAVDFGNEERANMQAMNDSESFPDIKGYENVGAQKYVEDWWTLNKNDTNPNVTPELSPVFEKTIGGITWYGFTVDKAIVFANNGGGEIVNEPRIVMVTKQGNTFYQWSYNVDIKTKVEAMLGTFKL
ncbi:MAG: S-layer homology domain-containing protein [Patescibacteria group bacterium]